MDVYVSTALTKLWVKHCQTSCVSFNIIRINSRWFRRNLPLSSIIYHLASSCHIFPGGHAGYAHMHPYAPNKNNASWVACCQLHRSNGSTPKHPYGRSGRGKLPTQGAPGQPIGCDNALSYGQLLDDSCASVQLEKSELLVLKASNKWWGYVGMLSPK